jgi:tetratricopeptide (TPR) repeat protein
MRREPAVYLALLILTLVTFWPVCGHDFTNYDDPVFIVQNERVQTGLTPENVRWAFTSTWFSCWHPLTWLSHMVDCQLFGLNPHAHHAVNLGFHVANTLLVLLVLRQLTGALWRSAFVAALFALHPLHIQSVAWAAERKDVLSTFFSLLTIWAYIRYTRRNSAWIYCLALVFFALGLMAKSMGVTLGVILLLLDFWPLKRLVFRLEKKGAAMAVGAVTIKKLVLEKIPFLLLAFGASAATVWAQAHGGETGAWDKVPFGARLENAVVSYVVYLAKIFWPAHLSVFYPFHFIPVWKALGCALLLAIISWQAIKRIRTAPYLFVGWSWFVIMLLPVIGIIAVEGGYALADRYSYLPSIGIFLILAWGIAEFAERVKWPRAGLAFAASVVILACAWNTRAQLAYWQNSITLFTHALEVTSGNAIAENNLASALLETKDFEGAERHFRAALTIRPTYANAQFNLGLLLQTQGKMDEAESHFRDAIDARPGYARAHKGLGQVLLSKGNYAEAENSLRRALALQPGETEAQVFLGWALVLEGK